MLLSILFLLFFLTVIVTTGIAISHWSGLRIRHAVDLILIAFGVGISAIGLSVYVLLQLNLYFTVVAAAIAAAPLCYVGFQFRAGTLSSLLPEDSTPLGGLPVSSLDRIAALACVALIGTGLIDSITSPMTLWDAVVSWDKWATEWALRTNMHDRLLGFYPQLMPMVSSMLYKLTATGQEVIPITQYALHAFQPVIAFLLVMAILRLATLFSVPAWPALFIVFGSAVTRAHVTAGAADLFATALYSIGTVIFFAALTTRISLSRSYVVLFTVVFFGISFSKINNAVFLLIPATVYLSNRREKGESAVLPKGTGIAALASIALLGSFLIHQYVNTKLPLEKLRLDELNFDPRVISKVLVATTSGSLAADSPIDKLLILVDRFAAVYEFPVGLGKPVALFCLGGVILAGMSRSFWPLIISLVVQFVVWSRLAAYDTRNLLPALPILGICVAAGFGEACRRLSSITWLRWAIGFAVIPFCLWTGGRISNEIFRVGDVVATTWTARRNAIAGKPEDRIALFYPQELPAYQFLSSVRPFREAKHVMTGSRMYRWLPNGGYPLSYWSAVNLSPGDGYATIPPNGLPYTDRWTGVYDDGFQRLFLIDKEPLALRPAQLLFTGDTPPRLVDNPASGPWTVESTGHAGFVVYNLPIRNLKEGDSITWRVAVTGGKANVDSAASAYFPYDPAVIDPKRSKVVVDTSRIDENLIIYSGILTFSGRPISSRVAMDGILVGIGTRSPNARLQIREFRVSLFR